MKKIILLLVLFIPMLTFAQTWDDTVRSIEKILERYKPSNPGAQLAISRNGKVIFSKAWGMADMEHGVALTTTSPTEAGSVSKQFTAAAILLLEQQGKLSLNDDVRKYAPELKDYGTPITLRQMMQHTSGLKDWGAIAAIAGWPRSTKTYDNNDALYIISLQGTLNHKPGAEFLYSNSNYNLFAVIVERVSGMSLADFTKKFIFEPAGMTHTEWRNDFRKIVPNRAIAYSKGPGGYQISSRSF
jgi:CubicO group peptidase (beta-lactamase class C family)